METHYKFINFEYADLQIMIYTRLMTIIQMVQVFMKPQKPLFTTNCSSLLSFITEFVSPTSFLQVSLQKPMFSVPDCQPE